MNYSIGDKVYVPATIVAIQQNESGTYFELKLKANNKIVSLNCEEEDVVAVTTNTTPTTNPETNTDTDTETTEP